MTRIKTIVVACLLLSGCYFAHPVNYEPRLIDQADAAYIVRQVLMEQPDKHVPRAVQITEEYIEIDTTTIQRGRPVRHRVPTALNIYFNNLGTPQLHQKGDWYIVTITNKDGVKRYQTFTKQQDQALRLVDAIHSLRKPL